MRSFFVVVVCAYFSIATTTKTTAEAVAEAAAAMGRQQQHIRKLYLRLMNACQDKAYLIFHFYYVTLAHTHTEGERE